MDRGYLAPASLVLEVKSGNEVSRSLDQHTPFEPFCFVIGDREALKIREYNGSWLLHNILISLHQFVVTSQSDVCHSQPDATWHNLPVMDTFSHSFIPQNARTLRLRACVRVPPTPPKPWSGVDGLRWVLVLRSWARPCWAQMPGLAGRRWGRQGLRVRRTREQLRKDSYAIYITKVQ